MMSSPGPRDEEQYDDESEDLRGAIGAVLARDALAERDE